MAARYIQVVVIVVLFLAFVRPLGSLHGEGLPGRAHVARSGVRPGRASDLPSDGHPPRPRDGLEDLRRRVLALQSLRAARRVRVAAPAGRPPLEPRGPEGGATGPRLQHRRQFRHEHQLAELQRRGDAELLGPDAGADRAELRLGRERHGGDGGVRARVRPAQHPRHRQLLGRPGARHPLHPPAALDPAERRAHLPRGRPDPASVATGDDGPVHHRRRRRRR